MTKCAVLLSGGLDSAVLVADEATSGDVQPIYVSVGVAWESAEQSIVPRFLASAPVAGLGGRVRPLVSLSVDMRDVYAAMGVTTNPIPVKAALELAGHPVGGLRLPLVEADEDERADIRAVLERHGLLASAGAP